MPAGGHTDRSRGYVLDAVPPPRGIEQHISRFQSGRIYWAVLEKWKGFLVVFIWPEAHQYSSCTTKQSYRISKEGIIRIDKPPRLSTDRYSCALHGRKLLWFETIINPSVRLSISLATEELSKVRLYNSVWLCLAVVFCSLVSRLWHFLRDLLQDRDHVVGNKIPQLD